MPRETVKRRPRRRGPGWKAYTLALVATVMAGLGVGMALDQTLAINGAQRENADPTAGEGGPFSLVPRLREPMNVLVMATDVRYEVKDGKRIMALTGNTDTMILVRFDPASEQIRALAVPRDTRVPIPGHGTFKINAANPYGGPELAKQVVADFLQVPVDRYLLINTRAVVQLVDALGGINVFVPKNLHYRDRTGGLNIHLTKGWNHLDGRLAHDFLRFRHDELGDIGRVQRNQMFLQAILDQYLTPANLIKTPQLLGVAKENMETDLTNEDLVKMVTWGKDIDRNNVQFSMVPGNYANIGGVSYWLANEDATREVVASFLTAESRQEAKAPAAYRVAVRDGVGNRTQMRLLRKSLAEAGYGVVDLDGLAAEMGQEETLIIAQKGDTAGAEALAEAIGFGKVVVAATGNIYSDFTVVMGRDWVTRSPAQGASARF